MEQFKKALSKNGLCDLECVGDRFIWSNKHSDDSLTKERLNMVVANSSWQKIFTEVRVEGLPPVSSDHKP